jgi:hypothetical protein
VGCLSRGLVPLRTGATRPLASSPARRALPHRFPPPPFTEKTKAIYSVILTKLPEGQQETASANGFILRDEIDDLASAPSGRAECPPNEV